jgi:hypothetical protein
MVKLLVFTSILLAAAPLTAQTQSSASPISFDDQSAKPAKTDDSKRLICQTEQQVGSRLAAKRVCMTGSQWKDREQQIHNQLDQQHINVEATGGSPG